METTITFPGGYPQPQILELDNTKRSTFISCPRKYFYTYIMGYKPMTGSTALRYGIVWHAAMEGFYKHIAENGWTRDGGAVEAGMMLAQKVWDKETDKQSFYDDYRNLPNLLKSFIAYIDHFALDENMLEIVEAEQKFKLLMELDTEEEHRMFGYFEPFYFTGKLDTAVKLDGRPWINEHKSTGWALSVQKNRLHRDPQFMGYTYAATRKLKTMPDGLLVTFHFISSRKKKDGEYGKLSIDFERVPQIYLPEDIRSWREGFIADALNVREATDRNVWPMRQYSCYQYGACTFTQLCEQNVPLGEEMLEGFYKEEPWNVLKEE